MNSFRRYFPITRHTTYFNHASTGPLPSTAARVIQKLVQRYVHDADIPIELLWGEIESSRKVAAQLIHSSKDEIAFVKNTSQGIIIAMDSIPWKRGDNVVVLSDAFAANLYPFQYLWPDIEKRFVNTGDGLNFLARLQKTVNKKTRAISVDWVNWLTGVRLDLLTLGEFCRKRDMFLIVDAIQGLGALELDTKKLKIDFLACGSTKWLCGPQGVGFMYVAKERLGKLVPTNIGWLSAEIESFHKLVPLGPPKKTAARFEEGTKNLMGICALRECMKILLSAGIQNVEKKVFELTDLLIDLAQGRDFEIFTPTEKKVRSGIVSIRPRHSDVKRAYERLRKNGIIVSLREGWLRVSPHFYNTPSEIEKIFKVIKY